MAVKTSSGFSVALNDSTVYLNYLNFQLASLLCVPVFCKKANSMAKIYCTKLKTGLVSLIAGT